MKISTKLRRERKKLRKKGRRIAIDLETNVALRGLVSPRGLSVHTVVIDDASFWPPGVQKVPLEPTICVLEPESRRPEPVGIQPGELFILGSRGRPKTFPQEYLGMHYPVAAMEHEKDMVARGEELHRALERDAIFSKFFDELPPLSPAMQRIAEAGAEYVKQRLALPTMVERVHNRLKEAGELRPAEPQTEVEVVAQYVTSGLGLSRILVRGTEVPYHLEPYPKTTSADPEWQAFYVPTEKLEELVEQLLGGGFNVAMGTPVRIVPTSLKPMDY